MLRSMFDRPGLLRMVVDRPLHLVLAAAQGSDRRRTGGGAELLWAAPLAVAVAAAAAAGEEDGQRLGNSTVLCESNAGDQVAIRA